LLGAADLPDGADPPPLRDEGLVGDEDHGPLLDPRRDPLRDGVRALLPVLPRLPSPAMNAVAIGVELGEIGLTWIERSLSGGLAISEAFLERAVLSSMTCLALVPSETPRE